MSFSKGQKCTVDLGDLFAKCATKKEICLRCKLRKLSLLSKHHSVDRKSTLLPSLGAFPFWPDVVQVRAEVCRSSLLERQLQTVL